VIVMDLPSGVLSVDQITAGAQAAVFELPHPGRWHARVAWRPGTIGADAAADRPAQALVQFWPAAA
jgi:hypothetical protein